MPAIAGLGFGYVLKRVVDILGAAIGFLILSPMLTIVALMIATKMGTPILFRQTRPGLQGKPFQMTKLNTMRDAVDSLRRENNCVHLFYEFNRCTQLRTNRFTSREEDSSLLRLERLD